MKSKWRGALIGGIIGGIVGMLSNIFVLRYRQYFYWLFKPVQYLGRQFEPAWDVGFVIGHVYLILIGIVIGGFIGFLITK